MVTSNFFTTQRNLEIIPNRYLVRDKNIILVAAHHRKVKQRLLHWIAVLIW